MNLPSKHYKLIFFLAQDTSKYYQKSSKRSHKAKAKRTGFLFFLASFFLLVFSAPIKAATTTLNFSDTTPTLISGTASSQGAVYRFDDVAPGVDALVQVTAIVNAQLKAIDDNSTFPSRFQPTIAPSSASLINSLSYIQFDFKLISATASNPTFATATTVVANNVYFSAQDVDGNGAINTIRELVAADNVFAAYLPNPTLLQQVPNLTPGLVGYEQSNSQNVQPGIGTDDRYEFYSYLGASVSTFRIFGGNRTGLTGCTLNNTGCDRQNSWSFDASDVQKLDFGDAPQSYGNAYHPIPATPTIRIGPLAEGDDAPIYTVGADGDDITGIDDEDGVSSFPPLSITSTAYSLNVACAGSGTVAGWIDFNRSGVFDNTERAAGTCNGTSATLNWTGLSGLSAGSTYARLRMSSTAAEVTNPTGLASNGEVEDHAVSIGTTLSGTVFNDANGDKLQGTESGTNAGGLNAILVDSANRVVATTTVAANGSYIFSNVPTNATYTVEITNAAATVGATAPAVTLPTNWVVTGENFNGAVDATADGKQSITVAATAITNVNFGIERLPDTTNVTAASQINPGGTTQVQVPALSGTDPEDGALGTGKSFQIVTLPTNAVLYYNGTAVTAGQIITNYDPTKLTVDPNDGNITVSFTYAAVDAAGKIDPTPATVTMPFTALSLSGTVFDDANGNKLQGTESGTNAGGLSAVLVDNTNKVVATTAVAANGTYTFSNVSANTTYTVQITTATATVGATAPAVTLPTNWVVTGENLNGAVDATADGKQSITVAAANIANINFGIEQLPDTNPVTATSQNNPGGTTQVQVPALSGTDPEDGALGTGKSFQIVTLPANATLYYNGTAVTAGQLITSYDPTKLTLDPNDGNITVTFTYAAVDAAGQADPTPATVTMPFTALNLSGTVFDDANGDKLQSGEAGTNAGGLNAVLVDNTNKVVATAAVAANGTYSFSNISANTTYTVRITTAAATVGSAPPAVTLPTNWVATGENLNGAIDGTVDSILTVSVTTSSITGANFGIEQRPTAVGGTAATQVNPTGTNTVTVPPTLFTGSTDPDGTVASYKFTAFPSNTTSNTTSITINGINYTSASFPAAGVTVTTAQLSGMLVDPIDGAVTVEIPFQAIDNAGQLSSNTATVSLPFSAAIVTLSGTVFDDANGDKLQGIESGTNAGGLNAVLVDSTNKVVATTSVAANGTYTFSNVSANTTYTVQITTATATVGSAPPAVTLPSNWVVTGENFNGTVDTTADGKQSITVAAANIANINFGIEQLPDTNSVTATSQSNPGGTTQVQVPALSGTDPEDGALGTGKSFQIVTLPANATLYYNGTVVTAGQLITTYDPTKLTVDPNDGNIIVSFTYAAVDAAGKVDPTPATVTMPFGVNAVPNLLLVKRITSVNGIEITTVLDDPGSTNDNAANWPLPLDATSNISRYLQGAIDGGVVRPGDILDYTIYFLSNGSAPATNVAICDLVPTNSTFVPNSFSSSSGIALSFDGTTTNLTNVPDADGGHFIDANVRSSANCSGANTNGAVLVNIVSSPATLPNATAPGTPTTSYGFIRFRAKIN